MPSEDEAIASITVRIRGREFTGKCSRVAAIVKGSMVTVIIGDYHDRGSLRALRGQEWLSHRLIKQRLPSVCNLFSFLAGWHNL